jgi:hypothetical protein
MSELRTNKIYPRDGLPSGASGGGIVQIVNTTFVTSLSGTVASRVDTGLSLTITPTSSSNKILVLVDLADVAKYGGTGTGPYVRLWLMRGSTDLIRFGGQVGYSGDTSIYSGGSVSTNYLDSPATTSAVTYKVQWQNVSGAGTIEMNASSGDSTMTLMEVSG